MPRVTSPAACAPARPALTLAPESVISQQWLDVQSHACIVEGHLHQMTCCAAAGWYRLLAPRTSLRCLSPLLLSAAPTGLRDWTAGWHLSGPRRQVKAGVCAGCAACCCMHMVAAEVDVAAFVGPMHNCLCTWHMHACMHAHMPNHHGQMPGPELRAVHPQSPGALHMDGLQVLLLLLLGFQGVAPPNSCTSPPSARPPRAMRPCLEACCWSPV